MSDQKSQTTRFCVTLQGLPLTITLQWPFLPSSAGADFFVLHGDIALEDGRGLHALIALQMTRTVREVLPSLEPKHTESPAVNSLRKAVDNKDLEFLRSPKRLPVPLSSRAYDFKRSRWAFAEVSPEVAREFLLRKAYWSTTGRSMPGERIWLADPVDLEYLNSSAAAMLEQARGLGGLLRIEGEYAYATDQLPAQAERVQAAARQAAEELERKHAFERG
jgi:hypothetical protein